MPRQANRFGGGANTNRNGLHFEQTTSLNTALQNAGFIIANHFEVYDRNQLLGYSINQDEFSTIFLRQNGINDRAINSKRWKPDEAFINEIDKTVYIIEKKFQRTSGSVDEKLATFPFKIREFFYSPRIWLICTILRKRHRSKCHFTCIEFFLRNDMFLI